MKIVRRDPDKGYLDSMLWLPKRCVNEKGLKGSLTYNFVERGKDVVLWLWKESEHHILVPRCFIRDLSEAEFEIIDCRPTSYARVNIKSKILLDAKNPARNVQQLAAQTLLASNGGILQLSCGAGKTVIALHVISQLATPAIIHIDNMHLLGQWREEILRHLDLKEQDIGLIGDGVFNWEGKAIVLATYQTIAYRAYELPEEFRRWFGQAWWDEGHHIGAPTYCRGADLYYGKRFMLTATPYRDDGQHIIYDMHIGPVLYKDLQQELTPNIIFKWTGFELDLQDEEVVKATHTSHGEIHFGLLSTYLGSNKDRLQWVVNFLRGLVAQGRKVLVLSPSVAELANMLAVWNEVDEGELFTDIPYPSNEEVGWDGTIRPRQLDQDTARWLRERLPEYECPKRIPGMTEISKVSNLLMGDIVHKALEAEMNHRQKKYIDWLTAMPSNAGLMVYKVEEELRRRVVKEKAVTFAVHKYGKEGLDAPDLDTIVACEPMSKQNATQQFMGRVLRTKFGKKDPRVYILVDNIGLLVGMSMKMQKLLRSWAFEDGGPYKYTKEGYPQQAQSISKIKAFRR